MTNEEILRKFRRELMGSSVAHMTDDELEAWMDPWRKLAELVPPHPGYPEWFVKRQNEVRSKLLRLLTMREKNSGTCMLCGGGFWLWDMTSRVGSYTCLPCYDRVMEELLR